MTPIPVAITMGDPAGIGPEVVVKAASVPDVLRDARLVVFGDPEVLDRAARQMAPSVRVRSVASLDEAIALEDGLAVLPGPPIGGHAWGQPNLDTDAAQLKYIEAACLAMERGALQGVATAPISKAAIHRAGSSFSGHTDLLGARFASPRPVMMLAGPSLKVIPYTVHVPLRDVPGLLSADDLLTVIEVAHVAFVQYFGHARPRIAVAGLNPHAGEEGMFGDEESAHISPAIRRAIDRGIDARGPFPGDTVFHRATTGEFDVVIGMYHDQALTPIKLLDFDRAVNVTLGIPVIRTSVDHGTAYDIAGQGVASASSMIEAIRLCARMIRAKEQRAP